MAVLVLVGGQQGQEGTGLVADVLGARAKVVVRYAIAAAARLSVHTPNGDVSLSILPPTITQPRTITLLGTSTIIPLWLLVAELDALTAHGVDVGRFFISNRAHIIMPYHVRAEELEQQAYGTPQIDPPGIGVSAALADKINRIGIQAGDLLNEELLLTKLTRALAVRELVLTKAYDQEPFALHHIYNEYLAFGRRLRQHIVDPRLIIGRALAGDHPLMLESDQSALLDPDVGAYPFVSGASLSVGAAVSANDIQPTAISAVLGVFRSYIRHSHNAPLPTAMTDGEVMRLARNPEGKPPPFPLPPGLPPRAPLPTLAGIQHGEQHGYMSSMPRQTGSLTSYRYGWFDCVAARTVVRRNALSALALTHLSDLDACPTIKICIGYAHDGSRLTEMPGDLATLRAVQPIYEEIPGWQAPTNSVRRYADLPLNAQAYIRRIQRYLGLPVALVGLGDSPQQTIALFDPFSATELALPALNGKSNR